MSDLTEAQRLYKAGQLAEAERAARQLLDSSPDNPDALNIVAMCALMSGRADEALPLLERVVQLKPNYARSRANLALLYFQQRKFAEAGSQARAAIESMPTLVQAHATLGRALAEQGKKDEAIVALTRAIELDPNHVESLYWLGFIHSDANRYDLAAEYFERVLEGQPDHLDTIYALAFAQRAQGLLEPALATYAHEVEIAPHDAQLHSAMLFSLVYRPNLDARMLQDETQKWVDRHARPLQKEIRSHTNSRDPNRPLKIGYVSPYFREHAVGFFVEPILEHHDRQNYPITIYSDTDYPDHVTARMRAHANDWRDTRGMTDAALADLVRADRIDILVDLTQHSGGSRLLAFARKPAPVQVCYLGYPMPTGLPTIDYRLSDLHLDPNENENDPFERVAHLPDTYFCYRPPDDSPEVVIDPPCVSAGTITFVSQNALVKLNDRCIGTWARVLVAVPNSRLIIKATGCGSAAARHRYTDMFASHGIAPDRVEFRMHTPLREMMAELAEADIALDSFPYNGGTTTCHILWMGVPVVSLAGAFPVQRMGLSVLSQVGLAELVARDDDDFVRIATALANDVSRLRQLRPTLRDSMRSSPLMNGPRFCAALETIYRRMWKTWCESR